MLPTEMASAARRLMASAQRGEIAGTKRVIIDQVTPAVDNGDAAVKTIAGEPFDVTARLIAEGHDVVKGALQIRRAGTQAWQEIPMKSIGDDAFTASFTPKDLGAYEYSVTGWVDEFASWQHAFPRRVGEDAALNLRVGAELVRTAAGTAPRAEGALLAGMADTLERGGASGTALATDPKLTSLMNTFGDRGPITEGAALPLTVNRPLARFGSWYTVFPRSESATPGAHGTLKDVTNGLDRLKKMGVDVVYLTPIHPIGVTARKGANNAVHALPGEPGVPYAIGNAHGGHTAIHPELGTIDDFDELVTQARARDMDVAMDIAFQASPDHPFVTAHPSWFKHLPDGSIQFAENPPKRYEDVVPFDFGSKDWAQLWVGLTDTVQYWTDRGVRAYRVDNPHTKPFEFWKYLIDTVKAKHPDTVFLAEAFDRPLMQDRLAKAGFDSTYTHFPWKTTASEIRETAEHYASNGRPLYMAPNHAPMTPDILPENLQHASEAQFAGRAGIGAGIGPTIMFDGRAFEHADNIPLKPGSIELLDSPKYQIKDWPKTDTALTKVITSINTARRASPALQAPPNMGTLETGSEGLFATLRSTKDGSDNVLVVASTDASTAASGSVTLPLDKLGIGAREPFDVVDLMDGSTRTWVGAKQQIDIAAEQMPPFHYFQIRRTAQP